METTSAGYVRWEEVFVTSERGKKEVHYYLRRKDGSSDLAVVGKEKSLKHISYHYAIRDRSLLSLSPSSSLLKLRSKTEVIHWLNTIVPDSRHHRSPEPVDGSLEGRNACDLDIETLKVVQLRKLGKYTTEFSWLGSAWTCRKKRKHYQSFRRNGVKITVHDFVYVLAEEDKRLVAHLDDMYEDSRGNKMVVVRWFHKIDEVGIALPHNYNAREIFFSLCLQNLSIECIDGLASVLSPQHYEKFLNEAAYTQLEPFLCNRQFDNDDVKSFDITQVKGYWNQEILRYMFTTEVYLKHQSSNDSRDAVSIRPNKRLRRSKNCDMYIHSAIKHEERNLCFDVPNFSDSLIGLKGGTDTRSLKGAAPSSTTVAIMRKHLQCLTIGSQVEVLSQDSGIRGCWFRAVIIKRHKDKVKVRYQDIKDAVDEASYLEEWILASRIAIRDELGLRICGRTAVRPAPEHSGGSCSRVIVGSVVDGWWHDGWWEGIVIRKESEDRIHVYFPGEKRELIFGSGHLRLSQEWLGDAWKQIKERPELVTLLLPDLVTKLCIIKSRDHKPDQVATCDDKELAGTVDKDGLTGRSGSSGLDSVSDKSKVMKVVQDLSKDNLLSGLKWQSRKRRHGRSPSRSVCEAKSSSPGASETQTSGSFFIPSSLKVDHDNCKFIGDSMFSSSVVPPLTSLVMSR